jgi:hypothetical protein
MPSMIVSSLLRIDKQNAPADRFPGCEHCAVYPRRSAQMSPNLTLPKAIKWPVLPQRLSATLILEAVSCSCRSEHIHTGSCLVSGIDIAIFEREPRCLRAAGIREFGMAGGRLPWQRGRASENG